MTNKITASKSYQYNTEDLKRISRNILILYTPVIILFLEQLQNGDFDMKIVYALIISTTVDAVRRFITDYTK